MKTLITPAQVLQIAFSDGEHLSPQVIAQADIAAAEARWILPVIGQALYAKLLDGAYPELRSELLAAPVAFFTRAAIQPRLDIRTDRCGTTAPRSDYTQPAAEKALNRLQRQLLGQGQTLLRRAAEHLEAAAADFPEYDSRQNILNRCSTDGGIVLAHGRGKGGRQ